MNDKTTKLLLLGIALGLWANALLPLLRPVAVAAQESKLTSIDDHLSGIDSKVDSLERIARGIAALRLPTAKPQPLADPDECKACESAKFARYC